MTATLNLTKQMCWGFICLFVVVVVFFSSFFFFFFFFACLVGLYFLVIYFAF